MKERRLAKKVLLIGWDAADWKVATPLLDQGLMPNLNRLINQGVMGNLATLRPIISPMLWASIATGMRADKHGIHGFVEPDPHTGGVRPISSTSRRVKAIWNSLSQCGYHTHVVGWFASHPAEPIHGISISEAYPLATAPLGQPWPLPAGAVHPESLRDTFAELRMHPGELTQDAILPWIPRAAEIDQKNDQRLAAFAKLLAENLSIHNAATWILQNQPWDFMAVFYNGIDHFCHGFMNYHPPRLPGIPERDFEIYKDVVNNAYRFHDLMLATLLALAGPEATVLLLSDHGFHSDHLRPRVVPNEPSGPTIQHRPIGIFCMKGPHIRQDERIFGATLLDITPTLLTLFGLPVGEDMDGRVLVQAFDEPPEVLRIPSWEAEPGECGMHPADLGMDPGAAQAVIEQFVALGYIQKPEGDQAQAVETWVRELRYNLALVYLESRRPTLALPLLEEVANQKPPRLRFHQNLARCYYALGRPADARRLLEEILDEVNRIAQSAPDSSGSAGGTEKAAGSEAARKNAESGADAMPDGDAPAKPAAPDPVVLRAWADWLLGLIEFQEGNVESALARLTRAGEANPRLPNLHLSLGDAYLRLGELENAEAAFRKAIEIDEDSPEAHLGMAIVYLRQRRNDDAVAESLHAVSLEHFLPRAHFRLGVALARLGHLHRARLAFETSLAIMPGLSHAHRWLAALYSQPGGDLAKAAQHKKMFDELRRQRETAAVA
ncbi:MAG TPA: alkaline phosphatase family protein [Terriglobia bacterium]|nr:alkaline phosphatase family protein [Terriglobia bacterium]